MPTQQENLCQVNLALAYGVKAIIYYMFREGILPGFIMGNRYNEADTVRTPMFHQVDTLIGPYIEKVGPLFMSLDWDTAWSWSSTAIKPKRSLVESITCDSFPNEPLYLQLARLTCEEDSSEYYMLVNRRCLPTETVSGTIRFDLPSATSDGGRACKVVELLSNTHFDMQESTSIPYSIAPGAARIYRVGRE
jgi:hypothetical protein